ncbi:MAG TPA: hypothetical protein VGB12_08520 [bacterium]|jgi:hypothetical protein
MPRGASLEPAATPMIAFLGHFLYVLAAWTVTIKYLFPIGYSLWEGVPLTTYVLWDLWWAVHLWLGWALLHWQRHTFALGVVVSLAEIAIVVTKLVGFLAAPEWTIWRTNWFINKLFVLACFALLLGYLLVNARRLRAPAGRRAG